jgi:uncharacterized protein YbbC (DUF1343 family)
MPPLISRQQQLRRRFRQRIASRNHPLLLSLKPKPAPRLQPPGSDRLLLGSEVMLRDHLPALRGKRLALVANHTSRLPDGPHLVDTLLALGLDLKQVFAPEHGFRGTADAGETVKSGVDERTGLPVISLYGKNKKPRPAQLKDLDIILFDIQDVGTRFYTYISTMSYVMEAAAEAGLEFWVLDRPNPNGWYVEGPVLDPQYSSFIGLHEIPIVHGMTLGEYATLVNEEGWLPGKQKVDLRVIPVVGYQHDMRWEETRLPWIAPSPNLATEYAAYLYPALCWFEPTPVSVGRGTDDAFTLLGAPWFEGDELALARKSLQKQTVYGLEITSHQFMPVSLPGKSKYPKYQDQLCNGLKFQARVGGKELMLAGVSLFQRFYQEYQAQQPDGKSFFKANFERWPGDARFRKQVASGLSPEAIWESWQPALDEFRQLRSRYLLYPGE